MNYSDQFYASRRGLTEASANAVLDVLFPQLAAPSESGGVPQRVLDVGCATGIWLSACKAKGSSVVQGIDGNWVPRSRLEIAAAEFTEHNLSESMPEEAATFDLALCIEVAEHLDESMAEPLVTYLTSRAGAVLFSAAIPGQGGTGHINEQPQSYWRDHFARAGFLCFDAVRPALWSNASVNLIYRQNMLLYVAQNSALARAFADNSGAPPQVMTDFELDRVHPELLARRMQQRTLGKLVRQRVHDLTLGPIKRLIR